MLRKLYLASPDFGDDSYRPLQLTNDWRVEGLARKVVRLIHTILIERVSTLNAETMLCLYIYALHMIDPISVPFNLARRTDPTTPKLSNGFDGDLRRKVRGLEGSFLDVEATVILMHSPSQNKPSLYYKCAIGEHELGS